MKTKLKNLSVEKIALVQEGDNKGAEALIYKSKSNKAPDGTEGSPNDKTATSKATGGDTSHLEAEANGGIIDMKIDKSKLTPEEQEQLEALEKKAGIPEEPAATADPATEAAPLEPAAPRAAEPAAKSVPVPAAAPDAVEAQTPAAGGNEDIYKGLHPVVAAELESLRKWRNEAEDREMLNIAKKYEIIGKKPEELANTLKSLKAAGGGAYDQMIAIMDDMVKTVEQAGVFSEIGKNGHGGAASGSDAWAQLENHAATIQKSAPEMSWYEALDRAAQQHPDLLHEYEMGR